MRKAVYLTDRGVLGARWVFVHRQRKEPIPTVSAWRGGIPIKMMT